MPETDPTQTGKKPRVKKLKDIPLGNGGGKITPTTPGTLAWAFAQQKLSPETAYSLLQSIQEEDPRLVALLAEYDQLTPFRQKQKAIWDLLCRKHHIPIGKLYAKLAEASLKFSRSLSYQIIASHEPEVVEKLAKSAKIRKNLEHTQLFLEVAGAIGKNPAIQVNLNQQDNRQIVVGLPAMSETVSSPLKQVREAQREMLLEDGKGTEFVDVEFSSKKEEEGEKVPS